MNYFVGKLFLWFYEHTRLSTGRGGGVSGGSDDMNIVCMSYSKLGLYKELGENKNNYNLFVK